MWLTHMKSLFCVRSDEGEMSFSIPTVSCHHGIADYELWKKHRDGYLAAISKEDIDTSALHKYKICGNSFILASLLTCVTLMIQTGCLHSLCLGHKKGTVSSGRKCSQVRTFKAQGEEEGGLWRHGRTTISSCCSFYWNRGNVSSFVQRKLK